MGTFPRGLLTAIVLVVGTGAVGAGSSQPPPAASTLGRRPSRHVNAVPLNSALALEGVATKIYEALAAGQDLAPYISGVMTAFGVPPLGEADLAVAKARLSSGLPLFFTPQASEMADAFNDGGFISLDSFIAAANDRGATQKGTSLPLSRDYLTEKFSAYTGKTQYATGQVLPAFILALGKARAAHLSATSPEAASEAALLDPLQRGLRGQALPPAALAFEARRAKVLGLQALDPVWGDGLLDPLQLTLMLYAVSYAGAGPLPAQALQEPLTTPPELNAGSARLAGTLPDLNPAGYIRDQLRDAVTGEVQGIVGMPLEEQAAAQVSVCASLLLYGHKLSVTTSPDLIYHRQETGAVPSATRVDAVLTFQDDYRGNYFAIDRWMLENVADCTLPGQGTVPGKPLDWSVSDGLSGHGDFDVPSSQTNLEGAGFAIWRAVAETTPVARRVFDNQRDAVGAVIVRAGNLVPGWSGLERVVGALRDTGNTGDSPLKVLYYVDPCSGENGPANTRSALRVAATDAAVCADSWTGTFSYTNAYDDGSARQTVTWSGTVTWGHVVLPSGWERDYGVDSAAVTVTIDGANSACTFHGEQALSVPAGMTTQNSLVLFSDGAYLGSFTSAPATVNVAYTCPPPESNYTEAFPFAGSWSTVTSDGLMPHLVNSRMQGNTSMIQPPFANTWTWDFAPAP